MNTVVEKPALKIPTVPGTPYEGGLYTARFCLGINVWGLVVATADVGEAEAVRWGKAKNVPDACSYNDGWANTLAMDKAGSGLAKWVRELRIDGRDDWYLMSRQEALIARFELAGIGQFAREWYWTSTQYAPDYVYAWAQGFDDGDQDDYHKDLEFRARAVRRFIIS